MTGELVAERSQAEDRVLLKREGSSAVVRVSGEIVDYTGRELRVRHAGGREEVIAPERVVEVESQWTGSHRSADELFEEGKFAEAQRAYRAALGEERRGWVRRRIAAQLVWCHRSLNEIEPAVDLFLAIYQQDPATVHFAAIPLQWVGTPAAGSLEQKASELLENTTAPAAKLIGASWLISTPQRSAAVQALRGLLNHPDARIAFLADAQLWRTQLPTARAEDLARWQQRWDRMPLEIRAGPAVLLGQALGRLDHPTESALMLLRVPILQPRERELASHALHEAARQLEKTNDRAGAARLYREIVTRYPESALVGPARRAASELEKEQHKDDRDN